jgi:hypothetical protein
MKERSCSETSNNTCAIVLDIQLPTNKVNCTDTGMYRGHVEFVDGSNATDQVYIEVKGMNISVKSFGLLYQPVSFHVIFSKLVSRSLLNIFDTFLSTVSLVAVDMDAVLTILNCKYK